MFHKNSSAIKTFASIFQVLPAAIGILLLMSMPFANSKGNPAIRKLVAAILPAESDNAFEYYYREGKDWVKIGADNSKLNIVVVHYVLYMFLKKDHVLYNIITNEDIRVTLEINDMVGRSVYTAPTQLFLKKGMNEAELPVKILSRGDYIVSVYDDKIKVVKMFFVE